MIELIVVLVIIATMAGIFIATLSGTRSGDNIDRGAQSIYDDLILIRSRALSANTNHRLNFSSQTSWKIQMYNSTTSSWDDVGEVRNMPGDTYLDTASFSNAGSNLVATPRGLFEFNGANGRPYVTVTGLGATKTKSVWVEAGGAIALKIP